LIIGEAVDNLHVESFNGFSCTLQSFLALKLRAPRNDSGGGQHHVATGIVSTRGRDKQDEQRLIPGEFVLWPLHWETQRAVVLKPRTGDNFSIGRDEGGDAGLHAAFPQKLWRPLPLLLALSYCLLCVLFACC
jgi:hypothetical protein